MMETVKDAYALEVVRELEMPPLQIAIEERT